MANVPYPLTGMNLDEMKFQVYELIRQVYEEKIGGADLGDVFSIPGDVLTLNLQDGGGLSKEINELLIDILSTGGLQSSASGLSIKCVATGGLSTSASGLTIKLDGATLTLGAAGLKVSSFPTNFTVVNYNASEVLDNNDLGKIHIMDVSGGDRTFTLPTTDAAYIGYWIKLVRQGVGNCLRIQAQGADVIWNSSAGGYLESRDAAGVLDTHDYGAVNLVEMAVGQWGTPEYGVWSAY